MRSAWLGRVQRGVRGLNPGYFALVMATGIISVGLQLGGFVILSGLMSIICAVAFGVLVLLTVWRLLSYRAELRRDLTDPDVAFGFFTVVAGTNVLGVRLALAGAHRTTAILLVVSGILWFVLGYVIPWVALLGNPHRPLLDRANGSWFVWVVASQSVAIASATLEPVYRGLRPGLAVVAVLSWSVGVFLYGLVGLLVVARLLIHRLRPIDLTPPYWVAMGAASITVLAGARIVEMADAPMVQATRGLVAGLAVVFWALATWLIPALLAAGWWRHVTHRIPFTYDATWWSVIFPLGMYAVAGIYLGQADRLPLVGDIGGTELWVAFAAWVAVLGTMIIHLVRTVFRSRPEAAEAGHDDR
ncbi:tellurite resistance/C4-dicarboxylate transporter family protein [Microlunatus sp. Gsoil 973]|uniref:tellurite resistance/C4-dicarboxylate transporter family protein n=1 Tax=Microlunatus sp. Gsoil 973 TaxID=2672569 RepID=UPI001E59E411|nr:tellurite resistance/C4-dicarboxylate transporter family protein [Microlunatus sp. Gsoil 973]